MCFIFFFQTYHDSMAKLKLLTEDELRQIFGPIDTLNPLHQGLFLTYSVLEIVKPFLSIRKNQQLTQRAESDQKL